MPYDQSFQNSRKGKHKHFSQKVQALPKKLEFDYFEPFFITNAVVNWKQYLPLEKFELICFLKRQNFAKITHNKD